MRKPCSIETSLLVARIHPPPAQVCCRSGQGVSSSRSKGLPVQTSLTGELRLQLLGTWTAFTLPDLPGLTVWMDANMLTYQDVGETLPATMDGEPVAAWSSRPPVSLAFTQASAPRQAVLKTNQQNGLKAVRCDGSSTVLSRAADILLSALTCFIVSKPNVGDSIYGGGRFSAGLLRIGQSGNNRLGFGTTDVSTVTSNNLPNPLGTWTLNCWMWDGATVQFFQNGQPVGSGSATGDFSFGEISGISGSVVPFNGDLGEIVLCSQVLSPPVLASTVELLRQKWNLW